MVSVLCMAQERFFRHPQTVPLCNVPTCHWHLTIAGRRKTRGKEQMKEVSFGQESRFWLLVPPANPVQSFRDVVPVVLALLQLRRRVCVGSCQALRKLHETQSSKMRDNSNARVPWGKLVAGTGFTYVCELVRGKLSSGPHQARRDKAGQEKTIITRKEDV